MQSFTLTMIKRKHPGVCGNDLRNEETTIDFPCTDMREFQDQKMNRNSNTFLHAGATHVQDREADDVGRHVGHNHTSKKETVWSLPMRM